MSIYTKRLAAVGRDVYYSVDVPRYCSNLVVWLTQEGYGTCISDGAGAVFKAQYGPQQVLLTVLAWEKIESTTANTLKVIGSVALEVTPKAGLPSKMSNSVYAFSLGHGNTVTFSGRGIAATDISTMVARKIERAATSATKTYHAWLKQNNILFSSGSKPFLQPTMVETDWTFNNSFVAVPALNGWPQMARLEFDAAPCFTRAVCHACTMLGVTQASMAVILRVFDRVGSNDLNVDRVLTVLTVCTLTAFAGTYPIVPECVDDRTLGAIKLGKNRDCDDMAITAVSVFNKLQRDHWAGLTPAFAATVAGNLSFLVHNFMLQKYKTAAAVVCRADPTVAAGGCANRSSFMCGHVYAILSTASVQTDGNCEDLVRQATVIEATRISSPFPQDLDSSTFFLDGTRVFERRAYVNGEHDVQTVKPFMPQQYPQNIVAYTTRHTYALAYTDGPSPKIGIKGSDMHAGGKNITALRVPTTMQDRYLFDSLAHRVHLGKVDDAVLRHCWWAKLGFAGPPAKSTPAAPVHWTHFIGDSCHSSTQPITSLFTYGAYVVVDHNNCIVECTDANT